MSAPQGVAVVCSKCEEELSPRFIVCPFCGTPIPQGVSATGSEAHTIASEKSECREPDASLGDKNTSKQPQETSSKVVISDVDMDILSQSSPVGQKRPIEAEDDSGGDQKRRATSPHPPLSSNQPYCVDPSVNETTFDNNLPEKKSEIQPVSTTNRKQLEHHLQHDQHDSLARPPLQPHIRVEEEVTQYPLGLNTVQQTFPYAQPSSYAAKAAATTPSTGDSTCRKNNNQAKEKKIQDATGKDVEGRDTSRDVSTYSGTLYYTWRGLMV